MKRFALAALTCFASASALATPIAYTTLNNNVAAFGEISPAGGPSDSNLAQYFNFYTGGGAVTIDGDRIDGGYDMAFWLFAGLFSDTNAFAGSFDGGDAGFITFDDDSTGPAVAGPFGDPYFNGVLAAGWYTVAVTNYASNGNTGTDGGYDFSLTGSNISSPVSVPEPLSLTLLGLGLAAAAVARRRS